LKKSLFANAVASLVASFGLVVSSAAVAQAPVNVQPVAAEVMVMTATVNSIDLKKRVVVLKDANGNLAEMNVSKQVNDLEKVKKGDLFVVEHAQAIAIGLTAAPKDANPGVSGVRKVIVSAKGSARPFEETIDTVFATVKISTIDTKTRVVTFAMPSGEMQKVKVDPSVLELDKFKAGDDVVVVFVDDTAIGFVTPPKK